MMAAYKNPDLYGLYDFFGRPSIYKYLNYSQKVWLEPQCKPRDA